MTQYDKMYVKQIPVPSEMTDVIKSEMHPHGKELGNMLCQDYLEVRYLLVSVVGHRFRVTLSLGKILNTQYISQKIMEELGGIFCEWLVYLNFEAVIYIYIYIYDRKLVY